MYQCIKTNEAAANQSVAMETGDHSKNWTKRMLFFCLSLFFATTFVCIAQESQDVVYLKNGNIVRGSIIEFVPDDYVDIRMPNGRIRSYDMVDVERIVKERTRPESRTSRPSQNNARSQQNDYLSSQYNDRYEPNDNDRYSQNSNRNQQKRKIFYVTPKVGLNKPYHDGVQVGFDVGCAFEYAFTPRFTLETGLIYSNRDGDSKKNFHYFYIPLYPKLYIHRGFNVFAGPHFGVIKEPMYLGDGEYSWYSFKRHHSICAGLGYLFYGGLSVSLSYSFSGIFNSFSVPQHRHFLAHIGWSF